MDTKTIAMLALGGAAVYFVMEKKRKEREEEAVEAALIEDQAKREAHAQELVRLRTEAARRRRPIEPGVIKWGPRPVAPVVPKVVPKAPAKPTGPRHTAPPASVATPIMNRLKGIVLNLRSTTDKSGAEAGQWRDYWRKETRSWARAIENAVTGTTMLGKSQLRAGASCPGSENTTNPTCSEGVYSTSKAGVYVVVIRPPFYDTVVAVRVSVSGNKVTIDHRSKSLFEQRVSNAIRKKVEGKFARREQRLAEQTPEQVKQYMSMMVPELAKKPPTAEELKLMKTMMVPSWEKILAHHGAGSSFSSWYNAQPESKTDWKPLTVFFQEHGVIAKTNPYGMVPDFGYLGSYI